MVAHRPLLAPLFVPAIRPDRIAKAVRSGADAIIVDLEDSVPPSEKDTARHGLSAYLADCRVPVWLRIDPFGHRWMLSQTIEKVTVKDMQARWGEETGA